MTNAQEVPHKDVFDLLCEELPHLPCPIWTDGDKILCKDEILANHIADLLDAIGYDAVTGYYDPKEDADSGDTDSYTGYHYIEV